MNSSECYGILGIGKNASLKEIKQAYRQLSLKYHPDRNRNELDGLKFKEITEAYQILRKEKKKEHKPRKDVESAHAEFWKYYEKIMEDEFRFYNKTNFSNYSSPFGANSSQDQHSNVAKKISHKITHLILYVGLSLIAIWIILSELFK
ncbi:MAG: DnaJ domain-containing protein [Thaumarchaeota archaeon]|nr:DnaJ domain-containing protein [Nitrososphaerota archaeon]